MTTFTVAPSSGVPYADALFLHYCGFIDATFYHVENDEVTSRTKCQQLELYPLSVCHFQVVYQLVVSTLLSSYGSEVRTYST